MSATDPTAQAPVDGASLPAADQHPVDCLLAIMSKLRAEGGCPWDREQTLDSLKQYLIEEAYEVLDAIDAHDPAKHREELGDLLLQVVFQAQVCREAGQFEFADVARQLCEKLIRRHPHVFGQSTVSGSQDVLKQWEAIKAGEGGGAPKSLVSGVPRHLPALQKAHQIQARAARVGFDWTQVHDVLAKVDEELAEVREAVKAGRAEEIKEELGDLLFAVVNLARFLNVKSEEALSGTVDKFVRRFQEIERRVHSAGRTLQDCTLEEMDRIWEAIKHDE